MQKLKLRIETLAVESFSTHEPEAADGTVLAHSGDSCNTINDQTCRNFNTCGGHGTCDGEQTCNQNCWPQPPQGYIGIGNDPTP